LNTLTQIVESVTCRAHELQNRRASLATLAAVALVRATGEPVTTAAKAKRKSCSKVRKKALREGDLRCRLQVPTCETALSAVCQPGPDVQECLDNTSKCCELLRDCDALAAMTCVVQNFIV
jgi:hypothetical protein